jgi:hypothetical protein
VSLFNVLLLFAAVFGWYRAWTFHQMGVKALDERDAIARQLIEHARKDK